MEDTKQEWGALIDEFENQLIKTAHENWQVKFSGLLHSPDDCPARKRRQDPPFCGKCHSWMRTWESLGFKEYQEIRDTYDDIIGAALKEYEKQLANQFESAKNLTKRQFA